MADAPLLRIGTRGSPLARLQADRVADLLAAADPALAEPGAVEVAVIRTTGDKVLDKPLAEIGGKGLFAKEIDEALLAGRVDIAVHSVKDLETRLAAGLRLAAVLERDDPRDVLIARDDAGLDELAPGSVIGTASLRRQAQVLHRRPDLKVTTLRGNVETRIGKVEKGEVDATLLAAAGLGRLGLLDKATRVLEPADFLPAVGQGAIGVTCREDDDEAAACLAAVNHRPSWESVAAERAMLEALDGSCRTPIAGLAEHRDGDALALRGLVARPDGSALFETDRRGPVAEAEAMGRDAGEELRRRAGPDLFQ